MFVLKYTGYVLPRPIRNIITKFTFPFVSKSLYELDVKISVKIM